MGVELNQRVVFALMGPATTVTTGGRLCSRRSIKARLLILQNHVYGAKDHPRIIQGSSSCPNMEKTAGRRRAMWGHKNFTQLLKLLGPYGYRCSEGVETPRLCNSHTKIFVWSFSKIFHVFHDFWWFLMIVFPTSKHCFRSHGVFLRAADLGSMAAQVPAGGEAKPHGQGDFVFRASDFSADLMIGKNQQNCRFHILRWFPILSLVKLILKRFSELSETRFVPRWMRWPRC